MIKTALADWQARQRFKSLAEFAPGGAKKFKSVFGRDMCVAENTSQPASVESVRLQRTDYARGGL